MGKLEGVPVDSGALFDSSGTYRYTLWRRWSIDHPQVAFIMLNPSTADEQSNDPTIRRCIDFAWTWGFGGLEIVNLFAYRATLPRQLLKAEKPIGAENNSYLLQASQRSASLVLAWGTHGTYLGRDRAVLNLITHCKTKTLNCLGVTKDGCPRHPLYVKKKTRLIEFHVLSPVC